MRKAVTMRKCKKDVAKKFTPQLSIYETISKFNGVSKKGNLGQLEKLGLIKKKDSWTKRNGISVLKVGFQETDKSKEWFELKVIQGSSLRKFQKGNKYYIDNYKLTVTEKGLKELYKIYLSDGFIMLQK